MRDDGRRGCGRSGSKATKAKTSDCVAFKCEAQRKLLAEYEGRKGEFESYYDFLDAKARESAWAQRMERKFREGA